MSISILLKLQENILKKVEILKPKGFDPRKLLNPGYEAIKAMVHSKIDIFGSRNKA